MFRFLARLIGYICLAAAMAMGVLDGVRMLSASDVACTPLGQAALWLFPRHFPILEPAITRHVHPLLWDPVLLNLLLTPAVIVLFVLGGLFLLLGRPAAAPALGPASRP